MLFNPWEKCVPPACSITRSQPTNDLAQLACHPQRALGVPHSRHMRADG